MTNQNNNLIYGVKDKPKHIREWIGYTAQYVFAVLPATILISNLCHTQIAAGLISAGLGTLVFLLITKMNVSMVTSNSGATVTAISSTFLLGKTVEQGFTGVVIGGFVMMFLYAIASLLIKRFGVKWLFKIMPPIVSGTIIVVIGATLMAFITGYTQINGQYSLLGLCLCFFTMIVAVLVAHYGRGIWRTLPFLVALITGTLVTIILTILGVDTGFTISSLVPKSIVSVPDFAFLHLDFVSFDYTTLPQIILTFGLVSVVAMTEHIADVSTASRVAQSDYFTTAGLHRTLLGDGVSSFVGSLTGAQMTTTYSEYTGTMVVSRVASSYITLSTAIALIALGFFTPFTQFLSTLPNYVFAGVAICAYGMIANTGVQTLITSKVDFTQNKNIMIFACMMSVGISGIAIQINQQFSITGIVLALIVGVILNLIMKNSKTNLKK